MGIIIPVKDGEVVDNTASSNSLSQVTKSSNSSLDKELPVSASWDPEAHQLPF